MFPVKTLRFSADGNKMKHCHTWLRTPIIYKRMIAIYTHKSMALEVSLEIWKFMYFERQNALVYSLLLRHNHVTHLSQQ